MSCCEDPLMIVMRRNLDSVQTDVLLETVDGWDAVVLRCCVDKGRRCFPPPRRREH